MRLHARPQETAHGRGARQPRARVRRRSHLRRLPPARRGLPGRRPVHGGDGGLQEGREDAPRRPGQQGAAGARLRRPGEGQEGARGADAGADRLPELRRRQPAGRHAPVPRWRPRRRRGGAAPGRRGGAARPRGAGRAREARRHASAPATAASRTRRCRRRAAGADPPGPAARRARPPPPSRCRPRALPASSPFRRRRRCRAPATPTPRQLAEKYGTQTWGLNSPGPAKPRKGATRTTVFATVGLAVVLVLSLVAWQLFARAHKQQVEAIAALLKETQELVARDSFGAYRVAAEKCQAILREDAGSLAGHAFLSYVDALRFIEHAEGDAVKGEAIVHLEAGREARQPLPPDRRRGLPEGGHRRPAGRPGRAEGRAGGSGAADRAALRRHGDAAHGLGRPRGRAGLAGRAPRSSTPTTCGSPSSWPSSTGAAARGTSSRRRTPTSWRCGSRRTTSPRCWGGPCCCWSAASTTRRRSTSSWC